MSAAFDSVSESSFPSEAASFANLDAGTYSLYTVPGEREWEVIINRAQVNPVHYFFNDLNASTPGKPPVDACVVGSCSFTLHAQNGQIEHAVSPIERCLEVADNDRTHDDKKSPFRKFMSAAAGLAPDVAAWEERRLACWEGMRGTKRISSTL